jgi:hypothetical protein
VLDAGNSRIQVFDMALHFRRAISLAYADDRTGLAVDVQGKMYVSDPVLNQIHVFSQEGRSQYIFDPTTIKDANFGRPLSHVDLRGFVLVPGGFLEQPRRPVSNQRRKCSAVPMNVNLKISSEKRDKKGFRLSAADCSQQEEQQHQQQRLGQLAHNFPHHNAHLLHPPDAGVRVIQFGYWHIQKPQIP